MAFMVPYYTDEDFHVGETPHGEGVSTPASVWGTEADFARQELVIAETVETIRGKWWCRLSAPGYMDCTEWDGPHATLQAARDSIQRTYDVDPETGDPACEECGEWIDDEDEHVCGNLEGGS